MLWRFSLIDYTINPSGVTTIVDEPQGWENINLSVKRDEEMHGIFFEFTSNELTFYGQGMTIIKDAYEGYGVEASVNIKVESSCDGNLWETFYTGSLVFSKYKYVCGQLCYVSIYSEQNDIITSFKNRLDQSVDLASTTSFDGTTLPAYTNLPKNQYLVSKGLYKQLSRVADYVHLNTACRQVKKQVPNGIGLVDIYNDMYWYWDCENAQYDEVKNWGAVDNWDLYKNTFSTMVMEDDGTYNLEFRVKGKMQSAAFTLAQVVGGSGIDGGFTDMSVDVIINVNGIETTIASYFTNMVQCQQNLQLYMPCAPLGTFDLDESLAFIPFIDIDTSYSATLSLVSGDIISCYMKVTQHGQYHKGTTQEDVYWAQRFHKHDETFFTISSIIYKPSTTCDLFLANESFARATESITNNEMSVYSDYFGRTDSEPFQANADGCGSLEAITKGLLIRQQLISGTTPKMGISFRDLFNGFNCIHNIGMGVEDNGYGGTYQKVIRIEPVEYFYDKTTEILSCPNVNQITETVLENRMFSNIEAGYAKYESEDITGIDEFLSKREYRTEWKSVKNNANRVCPFIASGYALEVTRRKGSLTTADWRLDNDNFIICMKRYLGDIVVEQGQIASPNNIIDDSTVYNFKISPIRNAARWLKTWFAGISNPYTAKLILSNGTGNTVAGGEYTGDCTLDAGVINENDSLDSTMLLDPDMVLPLWKPRQVQFEYPLSMSEYNTIKTNPYGYIKYSTSTNLYQYGYILNIEYKPNTGIANFTLLSANL
jgi:hypothetical protein